jgi:deoxycytidylate deaminase
MAIGRTKQIEDDHYYMGIADAVERGANCTGSQVGAVLVLNNRVISTGYNGTPSGFPNCKDGGCVRCKDSWLKKQGRDSEMSDPSHLSGQALDRCICVHAEQNAIITAARFGIHVDGATLYTTQSPCFGCLKEAVQAGIVRVVYRKFYAAKYNDVLQEQYHQLADHLAQSNSTRFEMLGGDDQPVETVETEGQPDPYASRGSGSLRPPKLAL